MTDQIEHDGSRTSKNRAGLRIGIDTGGTFTDLTLSDPDTGEMWELKVPSNSADPSLAIISGVQQIVALAGVSPADIEYFGHGTTVATNTLIELNGAKCALITTSGFRDLLEIGRQRRPDLYDFYADKPKVLIPRQLRFELSERLLADGTKLRPICQDELEKIVTQVVDAGVKSVAVCFLYSYLDPEHERLTKEALLRAKPDLYVYTSSEVLPEFREFERLSTTVLCAYLGPIVGKYSESLAGRAKDIGIPVQVHVMQSSGGIMSASSVKDRPIETALSGPAGGVIAAVAMGKRADVPNLITLDMGGTSADVCLIHEGVPARTTDRNLAGYPVKIPMLDVHTIGAGGGSIAWVDDGGSIKVGPMSAGAKPGPACYGHGGIAPAVTDANLVLGRIAAGDFLRGQMKIWPELAKQAIHEQVAQKLGMDTLASARGIITLVNDNMVRAVRSVSVEKGYDPREFTLLAYGGAGPLHAVAVARDLGMRDVLVPSNPGTFSSLGLIIADLRADFVKTHIMQVGPSSLTAINKILEELGSVAAQWLLSENVPAENAQIVAMADVRYRKQNYEHRINLNSVPVDGDGLEKLTRRFHEEHRKQHGYDLPGLPLEIVNLRIAATGPVHDSDVYVAKTPPVTEKREVRLRSVYLDHGKDPVHCPVYLLEEMSINAAMAGPLVVEHCGSTTWIPDAAQARRDEFGNLRIRA
jgi:N-methylhydantoinase A